MACKFIHPNDTIMARVTYRGRTIAEFISNGFSNITDILCAIRNAVGSVVGFLDISLRNASRGWTDYRALFIAPVATQPGHQLHLF